MKALLRQTLTLGVSAALSWWVFLGLERPEPVSDVPAPEPLPVVLTPVALEASTVHVGGTLEEISASEREMYGGRHAERPYLIVCQQSQFDQTRAPRGQHTGYAEGLVVEHTLRRTWAEYPQAHSSGNL